MGGKSAKFKTLTALGEAYAVIFLDRSSILLASTKNLEIVKPANFRGFFAVLGLMEVLFLLVYPKKGDIEFHIYTTRLTLNNLREVDRRV